MYIDSEKKKDPKAKPQPVIVRFALVRKRMEFMYKKLKPHLNFSGVYLSEDLTPLRAKMLKYVKKVDKNKFVLFHTINEKICMKQLARELGTIKNKKSDTGTGNRLTIESPDDQFKYKINIDFDKLNYTLLKFNIKCFVKSDLKLCVSYPNSIL